MTKAERTYLQHKEAELWTELWQYRAMVLLIKRPGTRKEENEALETDDLYTKTRRAWCEYRELLKHFDIPHLWEEDLNHPALEKCREYQKYVSENSPTK